MSKENVDLTHRANDAFNRRDLDAFLALMDDDVESIPRAAAIEGGSYHGHEGARRWWENLLDVFPDFTIDVGEVRDLGDVTVAALRLRWRRGKCVWWGTFGTLAEALDAVGLAE